jgi:hypothetical protein
MRPVELLVDLTEVIGDLFGCVRHPPITLTKGVRPMAQGENQPP